MRSGIRLAAAAVLLSSLWPSVGLAALNSSACATATDGRQAELDRGGIAQAAAGGLGLRVVRQCAGFSVVAENSIDDALAAEYADRAQEAYARLAAESAEQLSPRAVLLIFASQGSMATGERVLGGLAGPVREPRAGYTWMNTVWLDNSDFPLPSLRAEAVAHEFSHLFAAATAKGKPIPSWFNEGLAVDSEITFAHDQFAAASEADARLEQDTVLDALGGRFPLTLFALDELQTNHLWQQHYADPDEQRLEYAQAYMTVRAALDNGSRAPAWQVLHALAAGDVDFATAFQTAFGRSVEDVDAAARAAWLAQVAGPSDPLRVMIQLAPSTDPQTAQIDVNAFAEGTFSRLSGSAALGTTLTLEVQSDGLLVPPSDEFSLTTYNVELGDDSPFRHGDGHLTLSIRHADGSVEVGSLERRSGRWQAGHKTIVDVNAPSRFRVLNGPLSDPFPAGDRIVPDLAG